jgi:hypothetical protein
VVTATKTDSGGETDVFNDGVHCRCIGLRPVTCGLALVDKSADLGRRHGGGLENEEVFETSLIPKNSPTELMGGVL